MKLKNHLLILIWMAILLIGCGNAIEPGNTAPGEVKTVKATIAEAHVSQQPFLYEAVATINARTVSTISAKITGTVQAVKVHEGQSVKEGDLLVTIDPRTVTAQLEQAEAALKEARRAQSSAVSSREAASAAADLAASTFKRYQQLRQEKSVSQQEFDEVQSRYLQSQAALAQAKSMVEAAQSRIQQAQAAVQQARLAKADADVRSPYDGQVVNKLVDAGDLAAPGTPLLTIEQQGLFCADLVLPERHIQAVKLGEQVQVQVPALDQQSVTGEIGRIIPSADPQSRSFEVKVKMPETLELRSGMFARVFIPLGGTGMMLVPETAVVSEGQLTGLYVLDSNGIAHYQLVRTGKIFGDRVEILSGLQEGQRYVSKAPVELKDGMKVEAL